MFLSSSCSCLCPIHWSRMLSWEWRCSWSSADRRCSNYIWVINNLIAYKGATYIRGFTVWQIYIASKGHHTKRTWDKITWSIDLNKHVCLWVPAHARAQVSLLSNHVSSRLFLDLRITWYYTFYSRSSIRILLYMTWHMHDCSALGIWIFRNQCTKIRKLVSNFSTEAEALWSRGTRF